MSGIKLFPITASDIPTLNHMNDGFPEKDRHTIFKSLDPTKPYDSEESMTGAFNHWLARPAEDIDLVKAVTDDGKIVGWVVWGMRGMKDVKQSVGQVATPSASTDTSSSAKNIQETKGSYRERLEAYTTADLQSWMKRLMPPGTRCMYICSINVHPAYQGKGIGSMLMRHGTERADKEGVFCWVHSSEAGVRAFEKAGFKEIGRCEIDMDEWNTDGVRPPDGESRWGMYVLRYMRREPQGTRET